MARFQQGWLTKKSGSWLGHWNRRFTDAATGRIIRQQPSAVIGRVSDLTRSQAMTILRERVQRELGLRADNRSTVAWFIDYRWLPLREATWRESTKGTNAWILGTIKNRFGSNSLEEMDAVEMQRWLNDLAKTRSGSVVKHCRTFLRSILEEAAEQDFLRKNPAKRLRIPSLKPVTKFYLTIPQIQKLLKAAKPNLRDYMLLRLELVTALRPSELFMLRWRCLDAEQKLLRIEETIYKGEVRRFTKTTAEGAAEHTTVFLPNAIVQELLHWRTQTKFREDDNLIFPSSIGEPEWRDNYEYRTMQPLRKAIGVPALNFQVLRRTVATHAQHLGSPKDIATMLRHRKTETSQQHYIQAMDSTVRETGEKLASTLLGTT